MHDACATPSTHLDSVRIRRELLARRSRLSSVADRSNANRLSELLEAVDDALERLDDGQFGMCSLCHEPIERELLDGDPLTRICLECLTPDERRALEHDLELAAGIQNRLLPQPDFRIAGWEGHYVYRPHGVVSGDFCDIIRDGEATLVLLGDVSGKGIGAALLMSHLNAVFRGLAGSGLPLVDIMGRANRLFSAAIPAGSFATLVAARLMADGRVEISNAGHVPPLYQNGRVDRLPPDGVPLGLFGESRYSSQELQMEAGERLVLATDGLIESTDPEHQEYGIGALARTIADAPDAAPAQLANLLLDEVARFRRGRPATDDTTLMVVRRTGSLAI